jgi:hypothetical protein
LLEINDRLHVLCTGERVKAQLHQRVSARRPAPRTASQDSSSTSPYGEGSPRAILRRSAPGPRWASCRTEPLRASSARPLAKQAPDRRPSARRSSRWQSTSGVLTLPRASSTRRISSAPMLTTKRRHFSKLLPRFRGQDDAHGWWLSPRDATQVHPGAYLPTRAPPLRWGSP